MKKKSILGLMSGTSMDGLDCGLFNIYLNKNYLFKWECIDFKTFHYSNKIRNIIIDALSKDFRFITYADEMLGKQFSSISNQFLMKRKIDLVSSHGQTIKHIDGEYTLQIGSPKILNERLKVPIAYNFRLADILHGGNGAPLMPFLDWLIFHDDNKDTVTLNLGGIANVSFIPKSGNINDVLGFDTGPGMSLIDECCNKFYGERMDRHSKYALSGKINKEIQNKLMRNSFINNSPPKSTGRHEFGIDFVENILLQFPKVSPNDLIRTFCDFSAKSIVNNINNFINFSSSKKRLIISGGGVNHNVLIQDIKLYSDIDDIIISDKVGIQSKMKETLLMAVLGTARLNHIPSNIPSVTGARDRVVLGDLKK